MNKPVVVDNKTLAMIKDLINSNKTPQYLESFNEVLGTEPINAESLLEVAGSHVYGKALLLESRLSVLFPDAFKGSNSSYEGF